MQRLFTVLVAGTMVFGCPSAVLAQATATDSLQIEMGAARFVRDSLRGANIKFETTLMHGERLLSQRPEKRNTAIAALLGATLSRRNEVRTCGGTPVRCTLTADDYVSFNQPVITGNSAKLRVTHMQRTGITRVPIQRREYEIELSRTNGGWRVSATRLLSVS